VTNAIAQVATPPVLPQKSVDITMPELGMSNCPTLTTGSNCIRIVPKGDAQSLQEAIDSATCGDTIVLAAGSTYSGNFKIPPTSCSGWIEIVTNSLSNLPRSGSRVSASNSSDMAKIATPNASPAIQFLPNSNHWRLIGLEITTSRESISGTVYYLVATGEMVNLESQLPDFIIFDRIYIHGLPNTNIQHGIGMDTQSFGIVDSYCDEIHHNSADSQCLFSYNGSGPFLIQNNFIQASGENIMFGGADPTIIALVPSDITIIGNLIQKNLAWRNEGKPYNWVVKNLFELKNAQRLLLDGNVVQYTWVAGQAVAMLIRSVNQGGGCIWCVVQDITITHNVIQHAPLGIAIAAFATSNSLPTQRVLVQNNVLNDISSVNWGAGGRGWLFQLSVAPAPQAHDWIINHNTGFEDVAFAYLGDSGTVRNLQMTNNLANFGKVGIQGNGTGSCAPALNVFAPGYIYGKQAFVTLSGSNTGFTCPPGTSFSSLNGIEFTSAGGVLPNLSGNFQLSSSSPYHNAGTDGKDIGVADWACFDDDIAAAQAGTYVANTGGCGVSAKSTSSAGTDSPVQAPTNLNAIVH
jgi:hypothetical protein